MSHYVPSVIRMAFYEQIFIGFKGDDTSLSLFTMFFKVCVKISSINKLTDVPVLELITLFINDADIFSLKFRHLDSRVTIIIGLASKSGRVSVWCIESNIIKLIDLSIAAANNNIFHNKLSSLAHNSGITKMTKHMCGLVITSLIGSLSINVPNGGCAYCQEDKCVGEEQYSLPICDQTVTHCTVGIPLLVHVNDSL